MTTKIQAVVLTISDSAARGERQDKSGPALVEELRGIAAEIATTEIIPDDRRLIAERLKFYADRGDVNLIMTTGGTGLSPRDCTPEATLDVIERQVPGLAEAMRMTSLMAGVTLAMLSRAVAGIRAGALIVNLPGSVRGVRENFAVIRKALPHAIETLTGHAVKCGEAPSSHQ
jgi:molybdenum cofactor synthesis domain-containing protein